MPEKKKQHKPPQPAEPSAPARSEVFTVAVSFVIFLALSIYIVATFIQTGFAGLPPLKTDYRHGITSATPFLLIPLIVTVLLGAELTRLRRRFRDATHDRSTHERDP